MNDNYPIIFNVLSVVTAFVAMVIAWTFVLVYRKEPWRDFEAGRHLMYFTLGLAIILTWSVIGILLRLLLGIPPWLVFLLSVGRIAIFGWCALMLYNRLRLLRIGIRYRKEGTPHDDRQVR